MSLHRQRTWFSVAHSFVLLCQRNEKRAYKDLKSFDTLSEITEVFLGFMNIRFVEEDLSFSPYLHFRVW